MQFGNFKITGSVDCACWETGLAPLLLIPSNVASMRSASLPCLFPIFRARRRKCARAPHQIHKISTHQTSKKFKIFVIDFGTIASANPEEEAGPLPLAPGFEAPKMSILSPA